MSPVFKKYSKSILLIGMPALCVFTIFVGMLPPVRSRLDNWSADIRYALNPPENVVFVPKEAQDRIDFAVTGTLQALNARVEGSSPTPGVGQNAEATPDVETTPTPTAIFEGPTPTPFPTGTATLVPTALPPAVLLSGFNYQHQHGVWNYCGPATLATALSYWGWQGDRYDPGAYLRGGLAREDDKNVMPYEMQNYVDDETELRLLIRTGGDLTLLKSLLANGFPVVVEKQDVLEGVGWLGHYLLLSGYDDATGEFISMDAYHGEGTRYTYGDLVQAWRAFNYTFLIPYQPDREGDLVAVMGPYMDENWALRQALRIAENEIGFLTGRDLFFAWFNKGSGHVSLFEYTDAAFAFDFAFSLYSDLSTDLRPWRVMWYQTGPYWAYFYTGRYGDVITLANQTLDAMKDPILEESFYWRGLAREASGNLSGAIEDMKESVRLNPNFTPGIQQLARMEGTG